MSISFASQVFFNFCSMERITITINPTVLLLQNFCGIYFTLQVQMCDPMAFSHSAWMAHEWVLLVHSLTSKQ